MKKDLTELQEELAQAHRQVHISEARVGAALDKLAYMDALVNDRLLQERSTTETDEASTSPSTSTEVLSTVNRKTPRKSLNVSGPVPKYSPKLKNFWYPVAFSTDLKDDTVVPIECFEESWVIFRGKDGKPGCVKNTCSHRACEIWLPCRRSKRVGFFRSYILQWALVTILSSIYIGLLYGLHVPDWEFSASDSASSLISSNDSYVY